LHIDDQVQENYRRVREERGQSWAQLASDMEPFDGNVAAWMREQAGADGEISRTAPPKARRSKPKSEG
jgi:hypothetical protein